MDDSELSATDRAYVQLRGLLTSDGVRPGDHLGEASVAEWLGVSRTPVRSALQRLEMEQLVRRRTNGYVVASLTPRDVREACDVLRLVDAALFRRAAEQLTDDQLAELERSVEQMATAADAGDVDQWSEGDHRFHELLHEASDHALFSHIATTQRRRLHRFWKQGAARNRRLAKCAREHGSIVAAIAASDEEHITQIVDEHIDHMEDSLLGLLEIANPFIPNDESAFGNG